MGWKNIKEHFGIVHTVCVCENTIQIGSGYIQGLIVITMEGHITKAFEGTSNEQLVRYQRELQADPDQVRRLIETPDVFAQSVPVFAFKGAEIIEAVCEAPGWPNMTHAGDRMYDNTHFSEKALAVQAAKIACAAHAKNLKAAADQACESLSQLTIELGMVLKEQLKLEFDYPTPDTSHDSRSLS